MDPRSAVARSEQLVVLLLFLILVGASGVGSPGVASAHGPSIRVSYAGMNPATLAVEAGDTVHFTNSNASGATCTVVAEDGSFESPSLGRAEGWHYTFEDPGTYRFHLKEMPGKAGTVIVSPKRE